MKKEVRSFRSPKVEVRQTSERGRAIFAKEPIASGEMVFIKSGHIVHKTIAQEIDRTVGDFSMQITEDYFLAPLDKEEVD
jgi:hypothetical protein